MDVGELLAARGRDHLVAEVGALGTAVEEREFDAEFLAEVAEDVLAHIGLGGRGQAEQRRHRLSTRLLADEAAHVAVVGAEVVAPAREAVSLVQHPAADLALVERPAQGAAAELLRRDQEDARAAEAHTLQRLGTLGHGEHPVDGHAALDPPLLQARHLVRHQRDQGRDHHRQRAGLVIAGDRRDLVAERLARAGGQDAERVPARHRRLDDGLLHGTPVVMRRFGTKVVEAEPALHLPAGIVLLPAPAAGGVGTGGVPEPAHQLPGLGELVAHPGRHDRIAAGDREPGQRVGQRPAGRGRLGHRLARVGGAGRALQPAAERRMGLGLHGPGRTTKRREEIVEGAVHAIRLGRGQPVPGRQQGWLGFAQRLPLLAEDRQREAGVQFRVIDPPAHEAAVLIVLDQAVIGIAREGERAEPQRVHRRQGEQPQVGLRRLEVGQVEGNQVVAEEEGDAVGERVEPRQFRCRTVAVAALARIAAHRPEGVNAAILLADLQVEREAAGLEGLVPLRAHRIRSLVAMRRNAAGPYGDARIGSTSLTRT